MLNGVYQLVLASFIALNTQLFSLSSNIFNANGDVNTDFGVVASFT